MVYSGGLSKACETCRRRKVKCDEKRPLCGTCTSRGLVCQGYRNLFEASLRSNNRKAEANALRSARKKNRNSLIKQNTTKHHVQSRIELEAFDKYTCHNSALSILPSLLPGLVGQAQCFFIDQFVLNYENENGSPGFLPFLPSILKDNSEKSAVQISFTAVSCLLLYNQSHMPMSQNIVHKEYGKALQAINTALSDPIEAVQDGTLAAILLCCIYANIAGDYCGPIGVHGSGLYALIKMRGSKQFSTDTGRRLFGHSMLFLFINALNQGPDPNSSFVPLPAIPAVKADSSPPALRVSRTEYQFCDFWAEANYILSQSQCQDHEAKLESLLERGQLLDQSLDSWYRESHTAWHCREFNSVKGDNEKSEPWQNTLMPLGSVHTYHSVVIASVWNHARSTRILLHQILITILRQLEPFDKDSRIQLERLHLSARNSVAIIRATLAEICASIPFVLGDVDSRGKFITEHRRKALGGFTLIMPLKTVIKSRYSTTYQIEAAIRALRQVGYSMGVKQALHIAEPGKVTTTSTGMFS